MASPLEKLRFSTTNIPEAEGSVLRGYITDMGGQCRRNLEATTQFLVLGDLGRDRWSQKYNFTLEMRPDIVLLNAEAIESIHALWMDGHDFDGRSELERLKLQPFQGLRVCLSNLPESERELLRPIIRDGGGEANDSLTQDCHVLVSGQEKGRKVAAARQWQIPVVVPEWVISSLKRGAAWSPEMFLLDVPPEDRKRSLCSDAATSTVLTSLSSSAMVKPTRPRTAGNAWDSLMSAPAPKRTALIRAAARPASAAPRLVAAPLPGLFHGLTFGLEGFDSRQETILQKTLTSHDAKINKAVYDYLIVSSQCPDLPLTDAKIITEWAIERSLYKKVPLSDDVWGRFIKNRAIESFKNLKICLSGFSGIELLHLTRLIPLLGGDFCPTLTPERDLLVAQPNSNKFKHAQSWDIPIVSEQWLWECADKGTLLDLKDFILEGSTCDSLARRSSMQVILDGAEAEDELPLQNPAPAAMATGIIYYDDSGTLPEGVVEIRPAVNARRRL